jgi:lysophospholipase L1-like esterase
MKLRIALGNVLLKKLWAASRSQIELGVTPDMGGIALLGDSITHLGRWELLFPGRPIWNFGISGERSEHLLARLEPVIRCKPQKLFILIGTNDLGVGLTPEQAATNVDELLAQLREKLPSTTVYLQGVMPRARKFAPRIRVLNDRYRQIAERHDVGFVDLFALFDDGRGQMRDALSDDQLHLNGAGYRLWRETLAPLFAAN